ncbi:type II toxin-antitoxin system death-on-curing family toxin [Desulfobaculum bizertense]|uniref:Death-on-curing family protein n=1 Tax=Desulfobaculum bizertense DSM 18034 TaxID=1121442 RepID=A0A1T4X6T7_9BACT|nr:type II toxin-antitoxin system death-on-curing family toxin [Desulfobaculum bizertense]SKA84581.1 death-on-curing family protein [Desulfobaculum bizertense DSM 18034]
MGFRHKGLDDIYQRNLQMIPEKDLMYKDCTVCVKDVIDAHFFIVDYFLDEGMDESKVGGIGVKDVNMLCSAVARQVWYQNYGMNTMQVCASLLIGLVKDHAFYDCNKRTAILSTFYFLNKEGFCAKDSHSTFQKLTLNIANSKLHNYKKIDGWNRFSKKENGEVLFIGEKLNKITRRIEYDKPVITGRELSSILESNGYALGKMKKGRIDVLDMRSGEPKKIARINFKGMTRVVHAADLARVQKKTGLTPKNGYDSRAFYRGDEPLKDLIEEYAEMLTRLADR